MNISCNNRLDKSKETSATTPKYLPNRSNDLEDDDLEASRNKEFESRRKAHYNEFKMAQLLRSRIEQEDEDNDEGGSESNKNGPRQRAAGFGNEDGDDDEINDEDEEEDYDNRKF